MTTFGTLVLGGFALALLLLGRRAYRNAQLRRTIGILRDLATFWPRASPGDARPAADARRHDGRPGGRPAGGLALAQPVPEHRPDRRLGRRQPAPEQTGVDWQLIDPAFDPPAGDTRPPAIRGHSGYLDDPAYAAAVATVLKG